MGLNYSYIQLLNLIENFASSHLQLSAGRFASDFDDQLDNIAMSGNTWPLLYVTPRGTTYGVSESVYRLRIYCLTLKQKDRSNVKYELNDTDLILTDIRKYFSDENDDMDLPVIILNDPSSIPLNNYSAEDCIGHYMDVDFQVDTHSLCEIPFITTPIISGYTCDIYYTNQYLNCSDLPDCSVIQDIQQDIAGLQSVSGNTGQNYYTTGATLIGTTAVFDRNDQLNAYSLELSGLTSGITVSGDYLPLSGGTVTGNTIFTSGLSATTISGGTLYSGSTPLETVIANIASNNENTTYVQPGLNTYTGGTTNAPTVNISAATLSYLSATTVSASTLYSGSTSLETVVANIALGYSGTSGNLWSSSTGNFSIISNNNQNNVASGGYSIAIGKFNTAGTGTLTSVLGGVNNSSSGSYSVVAGGFLGQANGQYGFIGNGYNNIISSGQKSFIGNGYNNVISNQYSSILNGITNRVSGSFSTILGGQNNVVSGTNSSILAGQNLTLLENNTALAANLSAGTISGGTYYSGSTPLETIISNMSTGGASTYVQPGLNTYTGGTANAPTVNISAATLTYLSATTITASTIFTNTGGKLKSTNGTGELQFDYDVNTVLLTNDNGGFAKEFVYLSEADGQFWAGTFRNNGASLLCGGAATYLYLTANNSFFQDAGQVQLRFGNNYSLGITTAQTIAAASNSIIVNPGVTNSAVIAVSGITADTNYTLYTNNLKANTVSATTLSGGTIYSGTTNIENIYLIKDGTQRITVGTTAPSSPSIGDLWVDTN